MHDVFISYSSKDKCIADAICSKLENNNIRCWIAPRDILPGVEFSEAIINAIVDCEILLLVFSSKANESPKVRREIERGVSKGKIIIPFRIEDILPTKAMEFALINTHWLDALTPPLEAHVAVLSDTIRRLLNTNDQSSLAKHFMESTSEQITLGDKNNFSEDDYFVKKVRDEDYSSSFVHNMIDFEDYIEKKTDNNFLIDSSKNSDLLSKLNYANELARIKTKDDKCDKKDSSKLRKKMEDNNSLVDDVDCTVFSPSTINCGSVMLVQVFVHKVEDTTEAEKIASELDEETRKRGFTSLETELEIGTKLLIQLEMENVFIDEASQFFIWKGKTGYVAFKVKVSQSLISDSLFGKVIISKNSVPIGHITFKIKVLNSELKIDKSDSWPIGNAKSYKYAFISYATKDRDEVLRRVQMLSPLKISFFQDILTLDPGDRWEKEIYKSIDKADVFFLFWSSAASDSEWVLKEVNYALKRKQGHDDFPPEILPIIIEGPPIPERPEELQHIQFNDKVLYFMNKTDNFLEHIEDQKLSIPTILPANQNNFDNLFEADKNNFSEDDYSVNKERDEED